MKTKNKLVTLISLFSAFLMLFMAFGVTAAPGDPPFTLVGLLSVVADVYSVKAQVFAVDPVATICTDGTTLPTPTTVLCSTLNARLVKVEGFIAADLSYHADKITAVDPATSFTFEGKLKAFTDAEWQLEAFTDTNVSLGVSLFKVGPTTVKPLYFGLGDNIEAAYTVEPLTSIYLASKFTVLDSVVGVTYTHTGVLTATVPLWTVGGLDFQVSDAVKPPFFAEGDTLEVVFTIKDGVNIASAVTVLNSGVGNEYTFAGTLSAFTADAWTVKGETLELTFNMTGVPLPVSFKVGDKVEVTFKIVDKVMVVIKVAVTDTLVPPKTDTARCDNRVQDHPGVMKLAKELDEDPEVILGYFCSGFGLGEIRLAYKNAATSQYTPAMLLALRSSGQGWGQLKKLAASLPKLEESPAPETVITNQVAPNHGPDANPGKGKNNNPNKDKSNHGKKK